MGIARCLLICGVSAALWTTPSWGGPHQSRQKPPKKLSATDLAIIESTLSESESQKLDQEALRLLIRQKLTVPKGMIEESRNRTKRVETEIYGGPPPIIHNRTAPGSIDPSSRPVKIRLVPGYPATITIVDVTGQPWPIALSTISKAGETQFSLDRPDIEPHNLLTVSANQDFANNTVLVVLEGTDQPLVIHLTSEAEDTIDHFTPDKLDKLASTRRHHDSHITIRLDRRGPNAEPIVYGRPLSVNVDKVIQAFIDNRPPKSAKLVLDEKRYRTTAWILGDRVYLRTPLMLFLPAPEMTSRQRDMYVYTLSVTDHVVVELDGEEETFFLGGR